MKETTLKIFETLFTRYPNLEIVKGDILKAYETIHATYRAGGKVLVCGNGGSAADAEHIVGELLNKFKKHRALPAGISARVPVELAAKLEGSLAAISLVSMTGVLSAAANDIEWQAAFAQQTLGLAQENDTLIAISTSGNSPNCVAAAMVAKAKGASVIGLTGEKESKLSKASDVTIRAPETETFKIQELHLPIYHALCAALEEELFQ